MSTSSNSSLSSTQPDEYPYPVTQNVANFVSLCLSSTNFLLWKTQMLNILESYDLQGFISGETKPPPQFIGDTESNPQPNPAFVKWRKSDRLVKGWLTATLSEEVLGIVVGLNTSVEVWNALVHAFAQVSSDRSLALKQRLTFMTRGTDTLTAYLRRFKAVCDDLAAIGKPVPDNKKSWWLLNGLGKEYAMFTTTMLRPPVPPYAEVVTLLESYAERHSLDAQPAQSMVFYGQRTNKNRRNNGGQISFNSKGRGFAQSHHTAPKNSNNPRPRNQPIANKDEFPVCQICNKRNHTALKCFNRFNHFFTPDNIPQALAALKIADNQDSDWFPDTGATDHITDNPGNLDSLTPYHGSDGVMVGNGHTLPITHIGQAIVGIGTSSIKLNDVLLVPDIKKNLLSVSKLTTDFPFTFEFNGLGFVIKDMTTNQIVAKGRKRDGLYALDGGGLHGDPKVFFSSRFRRVDNDCWHHRLGHPHQRVIDHLNSSNLISFSSKCKSSKICTSCQMGKSCRLPFLPVENEIKVPFYKIHCDLWGPTPVKSKEHFRFYAIFVDDYTHFTWFFPLRKKSELFACFDQFYKYVKCQFDAKICVFQSDEGGEFADRGFIQLLANLGIHHQFACPKTPEQNGKAEQKHRNITELGLTMMFHARLPPRFWVDCFSTAVFLINRLTSQHLGMNSPFFQLYGKHPDYSTFRVLGSKCFPYLGEYRTNKLQPKSLPCVFIGYSIKHKGYKCLYPPTGRVYISRHVVFDEAVLPYTEPTRLYDNDSVEGELCTFSDWEVNTSNADSTSPTKSSTLPISALAPPTTTGPSIFDSIMDTNPIVPMSSTPDTSQCALATQSLESHNESSLDQACQSNVPQVSNMPPAPTSSNNHTMITRSKTGITRPNPKYLDFHVARVPHEFPPEPQSIKAAKRHPG